MDKINLKHDIENNARCSICQDLIGHTVSSVGFFKMIFSFSGIYRALRTWSEFLPEQITERDIKV